MVVAIPPSTTNDDLSGRMAAMAFRWPFRRYQRRALDAFERERTAGSRNVYLVLPPGAGKTAVGLEIGRRLGQPMVVLCPNTAVQSQWLTQWSDFCPGLVSGGASTDLVSPVTALTYQAFCVLDNGDPLPEERATESGSTEVLAAGRDDRTGISDGPDRRVAAARAAERRRARRLIARGGDREQLLGLLHPNGRELVDRCKTVGSLTLILDECHHLLAIWGALIGALIAELGDRVFVVGLTATPPNDMEASEQALYHDLFGRADFDIPTPAVVKEGDLAPYQELSYLTQPMEHETRYIAEQHRRFQTLLARLFEPDFASVNLLTWLRHRVYERESETGARLSWSRFERDEPELAQAALRVVHRLGLEVPPDARLGERHRQPPTADDWVALIGDFCAGPLKNSADPRDEAAWEEIRHALPALGYVLTHRGVRAYVSPVDRVLALSGSKGLAAIEILQTERQVLGDQLRALLLCDYEFAGSDVLRKLRGVLDSQAGSAALLLRTLLISTVTADLNPILLTGRTVACSRATAIALSPWLEEQEPSLRGTIATERLFAASETNAARDPSWDDAVVFRPQSSWWRPRHYVPLLTRYFEAGHSRCLLGTRGLLGEGWDAKGVNVLLDLTAAATGTTVHQMRGRSIRLDPASPRKVADNWDVVCVAPDHPKGNADYLRFVRKHRHYYAPTADGTIESGVSHVHPELSPFGPPPAAAFAAINQAQLARAHDRAAAYERWAIGEPYANRESATVRIRFGREIGLPGRRLTRRTSSAAPETIDRRIIGVSLAGLTVGATGVWIGPDPLGLAAGVGALAFGLRWSVRPLIDSLSRLGPSDTLEDFAAAVADALRNVGAIRPSLGPSAIQVVTEADGYYRCALLGATEEESARFVTALDELLAPLDTPRYLVPRYVDLPPRSTLEAAVIVARRLRAPRSGRNVVYHAVPSIFGANARRVAAFARAWNRHVSAGDPLSARTPRGQAILELQRGEDPFAVTTQMRTIWT